MIPTRTVAPSVSTKRPPPDAPGINPHGTSTRWAVTLMSSTLVVQPAGRESMMDHVAAVATGAVRVGRAVPRLAAATRPCRPAGGRRWSPSQRWGAAVRWSLTVRAGSRSSSRIAASYLGSDRRRSECRPTPPPRRCSSPSRTTVRRAGRPLRSSTQWAAVATYRVPVIGVPEQTAPPRTSTNVSAMSPSMSRGPADVGSADSRPALAGAVRRVDARRRGRRRRSPRSGARRCSRSPWRGVPPSADATG